jgi:hypothetical protein
MGTNFYVSNSEKTHIGKRSAAGLYCWECGVSLCKEGEERVHYGTGNPKEWHEVCPKCGKKETKESLEESTTGRELGFNKSKPKKKIGVSSCSSFCWAIKQHILTDIVESAVLPLEKYFSEEQSKVIKDEYGNYFTLKEFNQILDECPIQFTNLIGREFF